MSTPFRFTFENFEQEYRSMLDLGYRFVSCKEYSNLKTTGKLGPKVVVNRVDVDFSVLKARRFAQIFERLGITATFFLRLHAPEYNPFSFENYTIIKQIRDAGFELGYHSEIMDQAAIWGEDPAVCLKRDLEVMERMFETRIVGVASHGGMTGINNLDFWSTQVPSDFGLLYEAYDNLPAFGLMDDSFYVSDSEWTQWKCYDAGTLVPDDRRAPSQHAADGHPLIYLLVHPDGYYDEHFYEMDR